jgi:hypothetical protein
VRRALSVSLGPPERDFAVDLTMGGEVVRVERIGTGFDLERAEEVVRAYDGRVDAIGVGGANFAYRLGGRRYTLPEGERLRRAARRTPVTDGGLFKAAVEPEWVVTVDRSFGPFTGRLAVLVSALDRYALLEPLRRIGARPLIGDPYFALGLPLAPGPTAFAALARATLPVLRRVPLRRLYPSGRPRRRPLPRAFGRPALFAGDLHLLLGRLPPLDGAVVLTASLRPADAERLFAAGARGVVTGPAPAPGLSLPANAWEAALIAAHGPFDTPDDLRRFWRTLAYVPQVLSSIDDVCL